MTLRHTNHTNFNQVALELQNLDENKMDAITIADRAPNSSDKGNFWIKNTKGVSTIVLYIRDKHDGAWRSVNLT